MSSSYVKASDFKALFADGGRCNTCELPRPGWYKLKHCMVYITKPTLCTVSAAERYITEECESVGTLFRVRVYKGEVSKIALLYSETDKTVTNNSLGVVLLDGEDVIRCNDYKINDKYVEVDVQTRSGDYKLGIVRFIEDVVLQHQRHSSGYYRE